MPFKRSATSAELAFGPATKRIKLEEEELSDNIEDYDWGNIMADLNGSTQVRHEVNAADLPDHCTINEETFDIPGSRWRRELEDHKYLMATDLGYQKPAPVELEWSLPDETPDLDALDAEFATFPIEHFFEEDARTIPARFVAVTREELASARAKPTLSTARQPPQQPVNSQERSAVSTNPYHHVGLQNSQQQPPGTVLPLAHQQYTLLTSTNWTAQNVNPNPYQHAYYQANPSANQTGNTAVAQNTHNTAFLLANQQSNATADQSDDQSFACSQCGKVLKSAASRVRHEKDVHSERTFACPYCDKTYTRNHGLLKHGRKVHGVEFPHNPRHPRSAPGQQDQ
ncbi:hypothetical protein IWZ03DRAFT_424751 [Phyllosticta citriasiana]|uniref:C2H2-type domain-containing protein n=1 Tax=Phyllosticta citriasiana TaxID=595635 RepID=A0ABR1KH10_9PEZI